MREAIAESERFDDRQYHAMSVASLGWVAFELGDISSAIRRAIEGLVESHAMRDVATTTISLHIGVLAAVDRRTLRGCRGARRGVRGVV